MKLDIEVDELVEELRADLPGPERTERVRSRLMAAGVAVGTTLSGAASATSAAAGAGMVASSASATGFASGLWSAFTTLSWGAKVGLTAAVCVSTGAGPAYLWHTSRTATRAVSATTPVESPASSAGPRATPEVGAPRSTVIQPLPVAVAPTDARLSPPANSAPRSPTVASSRVVPVAPANQAPLASGGPSVAAFEPAPVMHGAEASQAAERTAMLREETALIDGAFASMRAGAFARAEQLLNAHQLRFPTGDLSRERARARERLREARAAQAR
ncbi:MAG TPA: hypothetical protein VIM73_12015 [Polyangiaceae bacterium]